MLIAPAHVVHAALAGSLSVFSIAPSIAHTFPLHLPFGDGLALFFPYFLSATQQPFLLSERETQIMTAFPPTVH